MSSATTRGQDVHAGVHAAMGEEDEAGAGPVLQSQGWSSSPGPAAGLQGDLGQLTLLAHQCPHCETRSPA